MACREREYTWIRGQWRVGRGNIPGSASVLNVLLRIRLALFRRGIVLSPFRTPSPPLRSRPLTVSTGRVSWGFRPGPALRLVRLVLEHWSCPPIGPM
eukprot:6302112-Pyramimonas_sp.AAC.1